MMRALLLLAAVAAGLAAAVGRVPTQDDPELAALVSAFAEQGVRVDPQRGRIEIDAEICQLYEPLEYLLIKQPQGKDHESLFACKDLSAEALNAAMLLLGVEKGENGDLIAVDPPPTLDEVRNGAVPYTVQRASGDGLYIYASWELEVDGEVERYAYRAEDLILNVRRESTYHRGRWVYLGSRFIKPHKDADEFFAAEGQGNLISVVYFSPADHLLTGADPEADNQDVWYPNAWLLPPVGHPVKLVLTREPLDLMP